MAIPVTVAESRWMFFPRGLTPGVVALIFEKLHLLDPDSLESVRLACKAFNEIAAPISYRTVTLNALIIDTSAELRWPHVLRQIFAYTQDVVTPSDLDAEAVRRMFERISQLRSVRWRYANEEFRSGPPWMPSDILNSPTLNLGETVLYVEGLPLRHFEGAEDTYLRAIPADLLVSLHMAPPTVALATRLASLKRLLLASRRLRSFRCRDRGQGTHFHFEAHEKLPAFEELALQSYDWNHDRNAVRRHWDFSQIRCLELVSVPIFNFLSSVSFEDFEGLQRLHTEDFSAHLRDRRREATVALHSLVKDYIRALHELRITCYVMLFPVDAVLAHAASLRILRLRDHAGFSDEDRRCPTLPVHDLLAIAQHCVHVHTLELDMDTIWTQIPDFLQAICSFPALHTLLLHVQTVINVRDPFHASMDPDFSAATSMFDTLLQWKSLTGSAVPWRSITINVGGWRPVMIRRLGEAWMRLNEQGIFAERCFVLEQTAEGHFTMWEERGDENSSWPSLEWPKRHFPAIDYANDG